MGSRPTSQALLHRVASPVIESRAPAQDSPGTAGLCGVGAKGQLQTQLWGTGEECGSQTGFCQAAGTPRVDPSPSLGLDDLPSPPRPPWFSEAVGVRALCDSVSVLAMGRVGEQGPWSAHGVGI